MSFWCQRLALLVKLSNQAFPQLSYFLFCFYLFFSLICTTSWKVYDPLFTSFSRMESTEKCEVVIQHFNGKYLKTPPGIPAPSEPLLCKFADGGQKKRQNQSKYTQNGRPWPREGEVSPDWLVLRNLAANIPWKDGKTDIWGYDEIRSYRKPNGFKGNKWAGLY